jgi:hypothetical protein
MHPARRHPALALTTAVALLAAAGPALASPETLRRGFGHLVQGPLDSALSPVTAGIAVAKNVPEVGESWGERALYPVFGYGGLLLLGAASGVGRSLLGAFQTVCGIFLFPFPGADLGPGIEPFAQGPVLVAASNPLAERPPWLKWVPPLTFFTIDARFGALPPGSTYDPIPQGE